MGQGRFVPWVALRDTAGCSCAVGLAMGVGYPIKSFKTKFRRGYPVGGTDRSRGQSSLEAAENWSDNMSVTRVAVFKAQNGGVRYNPSSRGQGF